MSDQNVPGEHIMGEDPYDDTPPTESQIVVDKIMAYIKRIMACIKSGSDDWDPEDLNNIVADAIENAVKREREECAKIAENLDDLSTCPMCPRDVAAAIRARNE